jgi:putative protease
MLTHIGDLRDAGVSSVKLEGRLKRAEYVAVITGAYRKAIDGASQRELEGEFQRVKEIFNRGGFTTGYYYSRSDVKTGCRAENSPSASLLADALASYSKENRKNHCDFRLCMRAGERAALVMRCGEEKAEVMGPVAEKARKPQEDSRYAAQLQKLGGTVFLADTAEVDMPEDAFIAVSELNEMRRSAVEMMSERLISRYKREKRTDIQPPLAGTDSRIINEAGSPILSVKVRTAEQAAAAYEAGADEVILDPPDYKNIPFEELSSIKGTRRLLLSLPAVVLSGKEHETLENTLRNPVWDGAALNNIGRLRMAEGLPERTAEAPMNVFNREAARLLLELGCSRAMLSPELTKAQMRDIIAENSACSVTVYGRVPLMHLLHCPVKLDRGCEGCTGSARDMTDSEGRTFPLVNTRQSDGCLVRLLNCVPTDLTEVYKELPSPISVRLDFFSESSDEIKERIQAARSGGPCLPDSTRGHWNRGVL